MRDEEMPDDRLERLGMWRHRFRIDGGHDHTGVGDLRRVSAVASDDADDLCADLHGKAQREDQIRADVLLEAAAPDRQHEHHVFRLQAAPLEPGRKHRLPAFVVRAGGQLRDVIDRRIRLDGGDLPEVVDGMRAVRSAATHAQEEQTASTPTKVGKHGGHLVDHRRIQPGQNEGGLLQMAPGVQRGLGPWSGR